MILRVRRKILKLLRSPTETQSGNEHETSEIVNDDVHVDAQPSNDNDVEI